MTVSSALGCGSTVTRLGGEVVTPIGPARTTCEKASWLVPAPTRVRFVEPSGDLSTPRDDGLGLYRTGSAAPVEIPDLEGAGPAGDTLSFADHRAIVHAYDTKVYSAAGLEAASVIAIAVGTALFATSFKTRPVEQTQASIGGGLVLAGLGLGIAGLSLIPRQAERARAEAARYVFLPPKDPRENVLNWTQSYNQALRARCGQSSAR